MAEHHVANVLLFLFAFIQSKVLIYFSVHTKILMWSLRDNKEELIVVFGRRSCNFTSPKKKAE